ncbi:hypothetical protein [uncultured Tateyamaria sp.]|uniref:hypothetical protein n=1 Tax=uncultured Tateyamaria sp. TaxID=455651 RepID=UPI00263936CF|nr:hypothetical protein [uncultured Tateyamaria sp.]
MINHRLTLDYVLAPGFFAPFIDGLLTATAWARRCAACQNVSYPPLRTCTCGEAAGEWQKLKGQADIVWRTEGVDGAFALVKFDGADTQSVVRLQGIEAHDTRGCLYRPDGDAPQMVLGPISQDMQT